MQLFKMNLFTSCHSHRPNQTTKGYI